MMVKVNVENIKKEQHFQYSIHYRHYHTADIRNYASECLYCEQITCLFLDH